MNYYINNDKTVAIADDHYLQPMSTCPRGVKVQLMTTYGVLVYGIWNGKSSDYTSWYPLPKQPKQECLNANRIQRLEQQMEPEHFALMLQSESLV